EVRSERDLGRLARVGHRTSSRDPRLARATKRRRASDYSTVVAPHRRMAEDLSDMIPRARLALRWVCAGGALVLIGVVLASSAAHGQGQGRPFPISLLSKRFLH